MNLSLCLIWVRRGSGNKGSSSGEILVNRVTMCPESPLQNIEKLLAIVLFASSAGILRQLEKLPSI